MRSLDDFQTYKLVILRLFDPVKRGYTGGVMPDALPQMPVISAETSANGQESHSSGVEKSVEAAIMSGNAPALQAAATQKTQAVTQRIAAIATADINESDAPETGVLSALATKAHGLASDVHREFTGELEAILKGSAEASIESLPIPPMAPPAPLMPPKHEYTVLPIAAQVYLDERSEADKLLQQPQANYEGHSLTSAIPYYEALLAQDPTDEQWIRFVDALKKEFAAVTKKRERAEKALAINGLQNTLEDNKKRNIEPTAEQALELKTQQEQFSQLQQELAKCEEEKTAAEEHYKALQQSAS